MIATNANLFELKLRDKNITLRQDLADDLFVFVDQNMFDFVIRNLLDNAIKFTFEGGVILVSAIPAQDDKVQIVIRDTGMGMSEDTVKKLFSSVQKDHQTGTSGEKGTGLGLVLCAEFIKRNGGQLFAQSIEAEGSTFTMMLPSPKIKETTIVG